MSLCQMVYTQKHLKATDVGYCRFTRVFQGESDYAQGEVLITVSVLALIQANRVVSGERSLEHKTLVFTMALFYWVSSLHCFPLRSFQAL